MNAVDSLALSATPASERLRRTSRSAPSETSSRSRRPPCSSSRH